MCGLVEAMSALCFVLLVSCRVCLAAACVLVRLSSCVCSQTLLLSVVVLPNDYGSSVGRWWLEAFDCLLSAVMGVVYGV